MTVVMVGRLSLGLIGDDPAIDERKGDRLFYESLRLNPKLSWISA
jgi:hypothetical protein